MSTVAFIHELTDAIQVLEATEQRLANLQAMASNIRRAGVAASDELGLAIAQLHRAVWVQRVALYGPEELDAVERARQAARKDWEEDQRAVAV